MEGEIMAQAIQAENPTVDPTEDVQPEQDPQGSTDGEDEFAGLTEEEKRAKGWYPYNEATMRHTGFLIKDQSTGEFVTAKEWDKRNKNQEKGKQEQLKSYVDKYGPHVTGKSQEDLDSEAENPPVPGEDLDVNGKRDLDL
jgi:hypothetical protein